MESIGLAHPPPLVGAGWGGGSRGPMRLANAPLAPLLRKTARPPSLILPHKGGGDAPKRSSRKLKSNPLYVIE